MARLRAAIRPPCLHQVQGGSYQGGVAPHQPLGTPWALGGEGGWAPSSHHLTSGEGGGTQAKIATWSCVGGSRVLGGLQLGSASIHAANMG